MLDFSRFSPEVLQAIETSAHIAKNFNCNEVTHCHMVIGLANVDGQTVCNVLRQHGYDENLTMEAIAQHLNTISSGNPNEGVGFNEELLNAFVAISSGTQSVTLFGMAQELIGRPSAMLSSCLKRRAEMPQTGGNNVPTGIQTQRNEVQPAQVTAENSQQLRDYNDDDSSTGGTIKRFCTNMVRLAAEGKINHAIGRDEELQRVLLILARNTKNNPVLVGEPGTGKTAIAEELAMRLYKGVVPEELANLKLYSLDFTTVKSSGDAVGVMKSILEEATADPNLVLFIDEIHMIISACNCSDNDIANLLKPAMARGDINILGATTIDEYKRIEKDPAFERRFQKVIVDEPDIESAIKIVTGAKGRFEQFHEVTIPDEVCKAAVTLSARYITNRKLPDKAFDLLDEAAANLRIMEDGRDIMEVNDLTVVVTAWTGIPVDALDENESEKLKNIEKILHESVVGQERAIKAVSAAIKRNMLGLSDPSRPIGTFLFLGTTGTGKTELCKAVSKFLFNDRNAMVRIDMSEYQQEYSVSRLFGAPPGYVGYEQGGQLTEAVRRKPFSVVLFDEIEKAHPKVYETLLQVLDDGRMTDGQGKVVDFKNTLIVMTSNMGQRHIFSTICGHEPTEDEIAACTEKVVNELRSRVAPEFINRIDNIVMFLPLTKEDSAKIAEINLKKEQKKFKDMKVELIIAPEVTGYIVERGYKQEYGGREIKRAITEHIVNPLTSKIVDGTLSKEAPILVCLTDNMIEFKNGTTTRI